MCEVVFILLWLGILAVIDLRYKSVPVWLLVAGGIFMTFVSFFKISEGAKSAAEFIMGLAPGVLLFLMAVTTKTAGMADSSVLLLLSLPLSVRECVSSFILSLFFMSLVSLLLLVLHKAGRRSKLPYIPFLMAGYLAQTITGL